MDKPRWFVTWLLATVGTLLTYHDNFVWTELKLTPFALAIVIIENYRSRRQNGF
jgi:hypothetical protein